MSVRAGRSQSLVLRGEAGIGKTALVEYMVGRAAGCRVARAKGVESEMELPFAGLHQLCGPLLDRLERLPSPQRTALRIAFALTAGQPPDRFMFGLATLGLLAEVAEEQPLVLVVDDGQWLDRDEIVRSTATSLDHSLWFHRPVRFDRWHLYTQRTLAIVGHRGLAQGTIHDEDGRLVATVMQECLARPAR